LSCVFDEHQTPLVAPATPASSVLRKAEKVRQMEGANPGVEKRLKFLFVRLQRRLAEIVESARGPSLHKSLDFGAVMVGWYEYLGSRA